MKKFLKTKLLRNCRSELGVIPQDCSLCDPFQKLFAKLWSVEKHGRHGGGGFLHCVDFREILLLRNHWSDFEIISKKCSLGDPFQKFFTKFWSVSKYSISKWGLLALYKHKEILVNSSLKATKQIGYGHLKNSGEQSRAILALLFKGSKYLLPSKILNSKLDLPGSELLMTEDGPPLPAQCNISRLSIIFSAPFTFFQQHLDLVLC